MTEEGIRNVGSKETVDGNAVQTVQENECGQEMSDMAKVDEEDDTEGQRR